MNILILTPYLPYPPSSGGQIRSYNLIKQLSKKHKITLFSLIKFEEERKYINELNKICHEVHVFKRAEKPWTLKNIFKTVFSLYPFLVIRNYSPSEKTAVSEILKKKKFDIIHTETFYVSPHIPKTDIPIVLVDQTIEYQVYQHFVQNFRIFFLRPLLYIDVLKIKFWETYYWRRAARIVAVSEKDAEVMRGLVKNLKVNVVPNGVGEDLVEDVPLHFSKTILFMGNYAWLQNGEAAEVLAKEVFPKIIKKTMGVKLVIAGQNIRKVAHLKSDNIVLKDLRVDDIKGVKKAYQTSGIMVAPLHGPGGTRLKILAAMSAKLPVVTTKIGNEGIDAKIGDAILVGNTSDELADLAIEILNDKNLYKKVAINARKFVEENYFYASIAEKLDKVYMEVADAKIRD